MEMSMVRRRRCSPRSLPTARVRRVPAGSALAAAIVLAAGCGEGREPITSYSVPKEPDSAPLAVAPPSAPESPSSAQPSGAMPEPAIPSPHPPMASGGEMAWDLPAGWTESGVEKPFRYATLLAGDAENPVDVSISRLGGTAGGIESNVNRWRAEVGLPAAEAEELRTMAQPVEARGAFGIMFDLVGVPATPDTSPRRVMVAVFPTAMHSWFIKAAGTDASLEPHHAGFVALCESVRFEGEGTDAAVAAAPPMTEPPPTEPPPTEPPTTAPSTTPPTTAPATTTDPTPPTGGAAGSAGPGGPSWGPLPDGWSNDAQPATMSVASFTVTGGGQEALVTVTPLGGTQDLLANVNRWRRQVGVGAVADLAEAGSTPIEVAGTPGTLVDVAGPDRRIIAVVATRDATTWFYKLSGPDPLAAEHRDAFEQFVRSIGFDG